MQGYNLTTVICLLCSRLRKFVSVKFIAAVYSGYELHRLIERDNVDNTVSALLAAAILSFMGLNVLQDYIFTRGGRYEGKRNEN